MILGSCKVSLLVLFGQQCFLPFISPIYVSFLFNLFSVFSKILLNQKVAYFKCTLSKSFKYFFLLQSLLCIANIHWDINIKAAVLFINLIFFPSVIVV